MFYKRLCDQWENEVDDALAKLEKRQGRTCTNAQKAIFRARCDHSNASDSRNARNRAGSNGITPDVSVASVARSPLANSSSSACLICSHFAIPTCGFLTGGG